MKRSTGSGRRGRRRVSHERRAQLLTAFEGSEMSAAAFARRHGISYSTFCAWRHQRSSIESTPGFVEVELPAQSSPIELVIELGAAARIRITSPSQIELAARLLQHLNARQPC